MSYKNKVTVKESNNHYNNSTCMHSFSDTEEWLSEMISGIMYDSD